MAIEGKKINELDSLTTVTGDTVLPVVYVSGQTISETAQKVSISQISNKVQNDLSDTLALKQDKLTAGAGIEISNTNVITATGSVQNIETVSSSSGTIALETNKVYKVNLTGNTIFTLPSTVDNTIFNQIYVQLNITGDITVNLGTTNYFAEQPELESGLSWITYEYNSIEQAWYAGKIGGESGGGGAPTLYWYTGNIGSTVTVVSTSGATLVKVYKNGLLLQPTEDYSLSGTTLTMVSALVSTDKITLEVF